MGNHMRNSSGFSLLELMIVVGIFMFVLVPVVGVFTSSYESYLVQDDISATQQNIRSATMYLRRDIRMAGAGLGTDFFMFDFMDEDGDGDISETYQVYGITAANAIGPNESDELIVRYVDFDASPCNSGSAEAPFCDELPVLTTSQNRDPDSANETSDDLKNNNGSVTYVGEDVKNESPYTLWGDQDCDCGDQSYDKNGGFDMPGILVSPNGKRSSVVVVTSVLQSQKVQDHPVQKFSLDGYNDGDPFRVDNKVTQSFPAGSTLHYFNVEAFQRVRYFLGGDNDTTLMRQVNNDRPQPLAEGIEDLQFDYLGDFDNDGSMEVGGNPEWYNLNYFFSGPNGNFANEDDQQDVRMVRFRMLARTSKEWRDLEANESPDLDPEDGTGTKTDQFRRRVIEQDVQVRNLGLGDGEDT